MGPLTTNVFQWSLLYLKLSKSIILMMHCVEVGKLWYLCFHKNNMAELFRYQVKKFRRHVFYVQKSITLFLLSSTINFIIDDEK